MLILTPYWKTQEQFLNLKDVPFIARLGNFTWHFINLNGNLIEHAERLQSVGANEVYFWKHKSSHFVDNILLSLLRQACLSTEVKDIKYLYKQALKDIN